MGFGVVKRFLLTINAAVAAVMSTAMTAMLENSGTTVVTLSAVSVCSIRFGCFS